MLRGSCCTVDAVGNSEELDAGVGARLGGPQSSNKSSVNSSKPDNRLFRSAFSKNEFNT